MSTATLPAPSYVPALPLPHLPAPSVPPIDVQIQAAALSALPNGTLLAVGSVNWNFRLQVLTYPGGVSRSVRAVPKSGPAYVGCRESGFGSMAYWRAEAIRTPGEYALTDAGRAVVAADWRALRAVGSAY